jgi:AcrR family transcriptional regulator
MILALARKQPAAVTRTPRSRLGGEQMTRVQRRRILSAVVKVVDVHGVDGTTVGRIVARAGVSRNTFYDLFEDRHGCLLAATEQAVALAAERARVAYDAQDAWVGRVRAGLFSLLQWCDEEPKLARLCVLHSATAGPVTLARRREVLEQLAQVVDEGRVLAHSPASPLTAEGVVNGTVGVIHARLLNLDAGRLTELLNPLMSFIVLPYIGGGAARRELHRRSTDPPPRRMVDRTPDAPDGLNVRLTYRTMRVLAAIAAQPGLSNAQTSERAGVTDQGQISKLLGRLARLEVVENKGAGPSRGGSNAWYLTPRGAQLERTVARELRGAGP